MSNKRTKSIEILWTKIGWYMLLSFPFFVFSIRGGSNIFGRENYSHAIEITVAGWGVFGFSLGLLGLSVLGLLYIRRLEGRYTLTPWPADSNHEDTERDPMISKIFLCAYSASPILSILAGAIKYSESHVSESGSKISLAQGFLESRVIAYSKGCSGGPCFLIHPDNGHEYILYLTDGTLILITALALISWALWIRSIIRVVRLHTCTNIRN